MSTRRPWASRSVSSQVDDPRSAAKDEETLSLDPQLLLGAAAPTSALDRQHRIAIAPPNPDSCHRHRSRYSPARSVSTATAQDQAEASARETSVRSPQPHQTTEPNQDRRAGIEDDPPTFGLRTLRSRRDASHGPMLTATRVFTRGAITRFLRRVFPDPVVGAYAPTAASAGAERGASSLRLAFGASKLG